jgi:translation initiation factor IF-2
VDPALAKQFAKENDMKFMEVSAKTGQGIVELFEEIGLEYLYS